MIVPVSPTATKLSLKYLTLCRFPNTGTWCWVQLIVSNELRTTPLFPTPSQMPFVYRTLRKLSSPVASPVLRADQFNPSVETRIVRSLPTATNRLLANVTARKFLAEIELSHVQFVPSVEVSVVLPGLPLESPSPTIT